jgi:hypothetical protein
MPGGGVRIRWTALPAYANHVRRLRDFVAPDQKDRDDFRDAAARYIAVIAKAQNIAARSKPPLQG